MKQRETTRSACMFSWALAVVIVVGQRSSLAFQSTSRIRSISRSPSLYVAPNPATLTVPASLLPTAESSKTLLDWSFVDAVYLITCPNADVDSKRLNAAETMLKTVNLWDKTQVKKFQTDDEDRVRGCYTSHISVLRDALKDIRQGGAGVVNNPMKQWMNLWNSNSNNNNNNEEGTILVLEDNLALGGGSLLQQSLIDSVAHYAASENWDMIHLSYTPYVPNLVISKTDNKKIVKLSCGIGSALGTTAYLINTSAIQAILDEDTKRGYYAAIPDVMAKLFPESRFASQPTPFVRAAKTPSLVNPQLDQLRALLFRPIVVTQVQNLLIASGISTNTLLPVALVVLAIGTILSAVSTLDAAFAFWTTGSVHGPLLVPIISALFSSLSLAILIQGILLAPKPPPEDDQEGG